MNRNAYAKVASSYPHNQSATTGWTPPTLIYDKMRQINVSAHALNSDINGHVERAAFKTAWTSWFAAWTDFFKKHQTLATRIASLTFTDELFQQVLSYESHLLTWYDAYSREKDVTGAPVPAPGGLPPRPNVPIPPSRELPKAPPDDGLVIPWWGWAIAGLAVAGAGYATYVYIKRAQAIRSLLDEKVVPRVLQTYGGPAGNELASGYGQYVTATRDPSGVPVVMAPGAGPSMPMPLPYSRYPAYPPAPTY